MARGGRVALQTVLGGLSGGLQGFQQAQARKKSEARQNIADLLAAEAAGFEAGVPSEIEVGGRRLTRLESPLKRAERLIAEQRSAATQMALDERRAREAERVAAREEQRARDDEQRRFAQARSEEERTFIRERDAANRAFEAMQKRLDREARAATSAPAPSGPPKPPTEAQERNAVYYDLMSNAQRELDALKEDPEIRPWAITAYFNVPGSQLFRGQLSDAEQQFIRAAQDFTAGVLRKETGAAATRGEVAQTLERYIEMGGEQPGSARAKADARRRVTGAMELSALPALQFRQYFTAQGTAPATEPAVAPAATTARPPLSSFRRP